MKRGLELCLLVLALASSVAVAGCLRVKPYEREVHARQAMQDPAPVDQKLDEHVNEYREGSIGGSGAGGGGCGCN